MLVRYVLWALAALGAADVAALAADAIGAADAQIRWSGRHVVMANGAVRFGYPSVSAHLSISGGSLAVTAYSTGAGSYLAVTVDDGPPRRLLLSQDAKQYVLVADDGGPHRVRVSHLSETWRGIVTLEGFTLNGGTLLAPPAPAPRRLLVIGDSVTCGEGVYQPDNYQCENNPRKPDSDHSYGFLLGERLGAETQLVCYGGRGLIRSWNGKTDELQAPQFFELAIPVAGGPAADLSAFVPDAILISLGTNDFNLGIGALPERERFVSAYVDFVQRLLALYPEAGIALTEGAIVNDEADPDRPQRSVLRDYIADTVARLGSDRVRYVASRYHPGDDCDAHPTGAQHRMMANELAPAMARLLDR